MVEIEAVRFIAHQIVLTACSQQSKLVIGYGQVCANLFADYMNYRKDVFCVTKTKLLRLRYNPALHNSINLPITIKKGTFKIAMNGLNDRSSLFFGVSNLIYGNTNVLTGKTAICTLWYS